MGEACIDESLESVLVFDQGVGHIENLEHFNIVLAWQVVRVDFEFEVPVWGFWIPRIVKHLVFCLLSHHLKYCLLQNGGIKLQDLLERF